MPFWKTTKKEEEGEKKNPPREKKDATEIITQVAKQQQSAEKKVVETKQVITFEVDKEEYAAPILDLREILRVPEIIAVPGAPLFVTGIFNLRGQIVMVIDLDKRFALKREHPVEHRDVIIIEVGGTIFGVMVDEVTGVLRIPIASIKPTPPLVASKIHAEYLSGVLVLGEGEVAPKGGAAEGEPRQGREPRPAFGGAEEEELAPEQSKKLPKTRKQALREPVALTGGPGQARILLLLDLPKMLSEEALLGFGNTVRQTVEEVK